MRSVIYLVLALVSFKVSSQYVIKDKGELVDLNKIAQEKVYVHHSGPLAFVGEYVHFALYCINAQTNRLSNVSSFAYIALVNDSGEFVFEKKVRLEKGLSYGDFFLDAKIPSGNYKLLAYTNWMKNSGLKQVYKDDMVIINPYQGSQDKLIGDELASSNQYDEVEIEGEKMVDTSFIQLQFKRKIFAPREKVQFTLKNYKSKLGYGNYTIRIQKKTSIPVYPATNAMEFGIDYLNVNKRLNKEVGDSLFLPEQRGELFFGTVREKGSGRPISDVGVAISFPGNEFLLSSAISNDMGVFYTYVREKYKEPILIAQFINDQEDKMLELGTMPRLDVSNLSFGRFQLKPEYAEAIKKRSVHNQLEHQFFKVKPDSILLDYPIDPFKGAIPEVFFLDDYTRFGTLQETLVEILTYAGYRNGMGSPDYIHINQNVEGYIERYDKYPALVFIDGVLIPNHESIKNFDARLIESIALVRDKFMVSGKDYQGMMSIKTFDGDFFEGYAPENGINVHIEKTVPKKNYFKQRYAVGDMENGRIPDYRRILLWEPHVEVADDELQFEFYTSDLTGEFEVVLDGFTTYGKPITIYKTIGVKEAHQ